MSSKLPLWPLVMELCQCQYLIGRTLGTIFKSVTQPTPNRKEREEKTHQIVVYLIVVCQCMWYCGSDLGGILHSGTTNK